MMQRSPSRDRRLPGLPGDNPWNQRVDALPVHPRSDAIVRSIGLEETVHPDFGSGRYEGRPIGIPYQVVARDAKRARVRFEYADESDRGRTRSRAARGSRAAATATC